MRKVRFRIPENLDYLQIIRDNEALFESLKLRAGPLLYILEAFADSAASNSKEMEQHNKIFVPLCTKFLQPVVHNYEDYITFLLQAKVLYTDNHHITGEKCRGYSYMPPYNGKAYKVVEIENARLRNKIRKAWSEYNAGAKKELRGFNHLTKWWETGLLRIDALKACKWLVVHYNERIAKVKKQTISKAKKEEKICRLVNAREHQMRLAHDFNTENVKKPHRTGEAKRIYSALTMFKKELKKFITYNGEELVEIDLKNSQPYLAIKLLDKLFWLTGTKEKIKDLHNLLPIIYQSIKLNTYYKTIINFGFSSQTQAGQESEIKRFSKLVSTGKFYEHILEHYEQLHPGKTMSRDSIKKAVLTSLYLHPESGLAHKIPIVTIIKNLFPNIYKFFELIKGIQNNYLPIILQRIESYLMLEVVAKRIGQEKPNVLLLTVHDNIITTKGNEALVKEIMTSEIEKYIGVKPIVAINYFTPQRPTLNPEHLKLLSRLNTLSGNVNIHQYWPLFGYNEPLGKYIQWGYGFEDGDLYETAKELDRLGEYVQVYTDDKVGLIHNNFHRIEFSKRDYLLLAYNNNQLQIPPFKRP